MAVSAGPPVGPLHDQQEKAPSHLVPLLIAQLQAPLPASVGSTEDICRHQRYGAARPSLRCLSTFVTLGPRTLAEAGLGDERSAHRWATAFRLRWTIWMKLDGAGTAQKRQAPETVSDSSRERGLRGRGIP